MKEKLNASGEDKIRFKFVKGVSFERKKHGGLFLIRLVVHDGNQKKRICRRISYGTNQRYSTLSTLEDAYEAVLHFINNFRAALGQGSGVAFLNEMKGQQSSTLMQKMARGDHLQSKALVDNSSEGIACSDEIKGQQSPTLMRKTTGEDCHPQSQTGVDISSGSDSHIARHKRP
jgi:hypothetical protein